MRKTMLAAAAAAAIAFAGGGAALAVSGSDPTRPSGVTVAASPDDNPTAIPDDDVPTSPEDGPTTESTPDDTPTDELGGGTTAITAEQAESIAVQAVGGGRVTKVELEWEHGQLVWGVEVLNGSTEFDIDVDSSTGQVVRIKQDDNRRGGDDHNSDRRDH